MSENLYRINAADPGRLAIAARPRGGDWLEDDIAKWRRQGVDVVVSLLTDDETAELGLEGEGDACTKHGTRLVTFPIEDRGVPPSLGEARKFVELIRQELSHGGNVVIHCRQGIGRSSLIAACLLVHEGIDPEQAWNEIARARGTEVPDTDEQRQWVADFAKSAARTGVASRSPRS